MEILFTPFSKTDYRVYPNVTDKHIVPLISYVEEGVRYEGQAMDKAVLIVDDRGLSVLLYDAGHNLVDEFHYVTPNPRVAQYTAQGLDYGNLSHAYFDEQGF